MGMTITALAQRKLIVIYVNRIYGPEIGGASLKLPQTKSSLCKGGHTKIDKDRIYRDDKDVPPHFPAGKGRFVDFYI